MDCTVIKSVYFRWFLRERRKIGRLEMIECIDSSPGFVTDDGADVFY